LTMMTHDDDDDGVVDPGGGGGGVGTTEDDGEAHDGGGGGGGEGGEGDELATHGGNHHGFTEDELKAHEEATKVKNVKSIQLGQFNMDTWYYSPLPREYNQFGTLFFCEYCLNFFGVELELDRHKKRCKAFHPPGDEIYRSEEENITISVFEVDGQKEVIYCQNLCYIAKLFLDHKTLEYDCSPFLFYILCEVNRKGHHIVGYFSKEKKSEMGYNLACILTLPCHQQKGFGKFLISLSYELSKIEQKPGSPEKPISDLGKRSYLSYWSKEIITVLAAMQEGDQMSLKELSQRTCIIPEDIEEAMKEYDLLKWSKGNWYLSKPQPQQRKVEDKKSRSAEAQVSVGACDPSKLHWTPFVVDSKERQRSKAKT